MRKMKAFKVYQTFTNALQHVWDHNGGISLACLGKPSGSAQDHCGLVSPTWDFQISRDGIWLGAHPRLEQGLLICRFQACSNHQWCLQQGLKNPISATSPLTQAKTRMFPVKIIHWKLDSELLGHRQFIILTSWDLILTKMPGGHLNR